MKPFERATQEGLQAAIHGEPERMCPYLERPGWSHTWRKMWMQGHAMGIELLDMNEQLDLFPGPRGAGVADGPRPPHPDQEKSPDG